MSINPLDVCEKCPLFEGRVNRNLIPVRWDGPANARLLIAGDNPGVIETDSGKLFTGEDKHVLLRSILQNVGIDAASIAFTYATRCSIPFNGYKLGKTELNACRPWLREEIDKHPEVQVIVSLGKLATAATLVIPLTKSGMLRGQIHDIFFDKRIVKVIPTVHSYQALISASDCEALAFDLVLAKNFATPGWKPFSLDEHKRTHAKTYRLVTKLVALKAMVTRLLRAPLVAFDTETRGLDPWHIIDGSSPECFISSIQFSDKVGEAFFLPVVHKEVPTLVGDQAQWYEVVCEQMHRFFSNYKGKLVAFNAKFDQVAVLAALGVAPQIFFDGMIYDHLRRGLPARSLKKIAWEVTPYGGYEQEKRLVDVAIGNENVDQENDSYHYPLEILFWYGCLDADVTYRLAEHFLPELFSKKQTRLGFLSEFLAKASNALSRIETYGWKLDSKRLEEYGQSLLKEQARIETEIVKTLGSALDTFKEITEQEFIMTSNPHLRTLLYQVLHLPQTFVTPKGMPSTAKAALTKLKDQHPSIPLMLEHRKVEKLYTTFYDRWKRGMAQDGRLHFRYNLVSFFNETEDDSSGAITGRLSSSGPAGNCQQIPKDPDLRHVFVPDDENSVILDIDFTTLEYVVTAIHSEDPKLVAAFKAGYDIHSAVGAEIFGKDPKEMKTEANKPLRQKAKTLNFAILYGAGARKIAEQLGVTETEAELFIQSYKARYPILNEWIEKVQRQVKKMGYSESRFGRRRILSDALLPNVPANVGRINAALRRGVNSPIQADASDICLWSLIRLMEWLDNGKSRAHILATVHDSVVLSVPNDELLEVAYKIKEIFEHLGLPFIDGPESPGVPLRVSGSEGPDWGAVREFEWE